jgi:hypothetical protein
MAAGLGLLENRPLGLECRFWRDLREMSLPARSRLDEGRWAMKKGLENENYFVLQVTGVPTFELKRIVTS